MEILLDMFYSIIDLSKTIFDFIFTEIEILDLKISLWQILAGASFAILFIAWLVKKLVPVAWGGRDGNIIFKFIKSTW